MYINICVTLAQLRKWAPIKPHCRATPLYLPNCVALHHNSHAMYNAYSSGIILAICNLSMSMECKSLSSLVHGLGFSELHGFLGFDVTKLPGVSRTFKAHFCLWLARDYLSGPICRSRRMQWSRNRLWRRVWHMCPDCLRKAYQKHAKGRICATRNGNQFKLISFPKKYFSSEKKLVWFDFFSEEIFFFGKEIAYFVQIWAKVMHILLYY